MAYSIMNEQPRLPSELKPDLPAWVDLIAIQALQKSSDGRPPDGGEVVKIFKPDLLGLPAVTPAIRPRARRRTVVVEHLANLSEDASVAAFCAGFREELITEIARRVDLTISPEAGSSTLENVQEQFLKYRCDYLIRGTLRRWEDRLKLTLSVYTDQGSAVAYAERFSGTSSDLLSILDQAAEQTAAGLAQLGGIDVEDVPEQTPGSVTALDYYYKGIGYYLLNKPEELVLAEQLFRRALEIDPEMALAHSGLSDVYSFQYMAFIDHTSDTFERSRTEAEKALALDPQLAEGHRSLGRYFMLSGDMEQARACFIRAIDIKPDYAIGHRTMAWLLLSLGEHAEAGQYARRALALKPTDVETHIVLGIVHIDEHRYTIALATLQRAIELAPDYGRAYYWLAHAYMQMGVRDLALDNYAQAIHYTGDPNSHQEAGYVHILAQDYPAARVQLQASIDAGHLEFIAYYYLSLINRIEGNRKSQLRYLEQAEAALARYASEDRRDANLQAYAALIAAARGDRERTLAMLNALVEQELHLGRALYNVARAYATLGDESSARLVIDRAMLCPGGPTQKEIEADPHFWSWEFGR